MFGSDNCVNNFACLKFVAQHSYWWTITDDHYSLVDSVYGAQAKVPFPAGAMSFFFQINCGF